MIAKKWRKIIALFTAMAIATAGVQGTSQMSMAAPEETATQDAGVAEGENAEGEEAPQQNVGADGNVVMDGAVGKKDKSQWITKKDYTVVAESDTYKMYLYEPTLSIMLENKETGKIIESTVSDANDDGNSNVSWNAYMKSAVVINAIVGTKNTFQVDLITCKNSVKVTKNDKGFSAEIFFDDYQFGLTMNVTLEGDNVIVNVPDQSIIEKKPGTYISTVSLYPMMGYSHLDAEPGYMLVPDGNGALINLDNKEGRYATGFSQLIYGKDIGFSDSEVKTYLWEEIDMVRDANQVIAPIFGVAHTVSQTGYLGIVEKGEKRASIEVQPNGVMVNYNRCFAKFMLRDIYVQPLNNSNSGTVTQAEKDRTHTDLQVRYVLLSKNEANYPSMANKYREYLLNNNLITKKDVSYNTRVDFLGTEREEFLLGTRAVTMTTTENIARLYGNLQTKGVDSVLTVYKGWQDGGLYNVPIKKYDADRKIGGTSSLTKLIEESKANNYNIYLYNDALRLNPKEHNLNFNMIKKVNKRTFEEEVWAEVYQTFYYLTPKTTMSYFEDFVKDVNKKGVTQIALAGISDNIYSYSYKSEYYTRKDTAGNYADLVSAMDDKADMIMEQPSAYLWKNTDAFLDMPLGSSDYMYVDEEIPFMSMVLKGIIPMYSDYVNFEANKQQFFLQMVESGVYPSFYLTHENSADLIYTNSADLYSTQFSTYEDTIVDYDKKLRELTKKLGDANIVNHQKMANGVTVVTYSNGTKVYVNYTEAAQIVDGVTVEAMSYSYKAGDAQ